VSGFAPGIVNYKTGALDSDKAYQLLVHGRWFSPGTPASSITKTCRHDIAEILLKVALKHQTSMKSTNYSSIAQTHVVLVIGLYELLGNPTTQLIEPPGPCYSWC
jgi:hypothetical protein